MLSGWSPLPQLEASREQLLPSSLLNCTCAIPARPWGFTVGAGLLSKRLQDTAVP